MPFAIGVAVLALVGGLITAVAVARGGNDSSSPTTSRSSSATTLADGVTDAGSPIDPALSRFDIIESDADDATEQGSSGKLIRVCNDVSALDGVPFVSPGKDIGFESASATSDAMSATSITGRFETAAAATAWFDAAVDIAERCDFRHTNGATELVTQVEPSTRPTGLRIVRFSWTWRGDFTNIVGDDIYFTLGKYVGALNCQLTGETIDVERCDELIASYAKRLESAA